MALEIERKFLVVNESFRSMAREKHHILQGYLSTDPNKTIRVRIIDDNAWICIKSRNIGPIRNEWEYKIPIIDAEQILKLCGNSILSKFRYIVPFNGDIWEVDEYENDLTPLIIAEVEMDSENHQLSLPCFVGKEVTGVPEYYNSALATNT